MAELLVKGSLVRARRRELGLTQAQLSLLAGVGRRTLQRMEAEPGVRFYFEVVQKVASALGLPLKLSEGDGLASEVLLYSCALP